MSGMGDIECGGHSISPQPSGRRSVGAHSPWPGGRHAADLSEFGLNGHAARTGLTRAAPEPELSKPAPERRG